MTPRTGVTDTISTTPENDMAPSTPMATPMSAVMMGRPAATSVPSMTNSTIAATTRPTASPGPTTSGIPDGDGRREVDADAVDAAWP